MIPDPNTQGSSETRVEAVRLPSDLADVIRNSHRIFEVLKSLAHPARLVIMGCIVDGATSVSELVAVLGLNQSTLSKQLRRLCDDGLIDCERNSRDRRSIVFHLRDDRIRGVIGSLLAEFSV